MIKQPDLFLCFESNVVLQFVCYFLFVFVFVFVFVFERRDK